MKNKIKNSSKTKKMDKKDLKEINNNKITVLKRKISILQNYP